MRLFPRNRPARSTDSSPAQNEINGLINQLLHRLADHLSGYEQKMTIRQKKIAITAFCFTAIFASVSLFYRALFTRPTPGSPLSNTGHILAPPPPPLPDSVLNRDHHGAPTTAHSTGALPSNNK